ncbi:MAG TPA: YkgJ family cysteine cluster protein [Prolixibacteraceae bacterium]|nr:YkgJ family cysteine cluster protein [Prolixibacteraceae bacterium]
MEELQLSEQDRIFYNDGYHVGQAVAEKGLTPENIVEGLAQLHESIDGLIDALLERARKNEVLIYCHRGCEWCCHQAVFANNLEMLNLLEFFRKNFSEEQLMEVARHAAQKNQKVSGMSEAEVLLYKSPCPLLKGGACIAYHARPMACRIYLSRSLSSCFEFFKNPGNPDNFPALIDFPLRVGKLLNEGFARAMRDQGVEVSEFRIEEGLDLFLNQRFDLRVISPNPSDQ